jgi:hypothetical protein
VSLNKIAESILFESVFALKKKKKKKRFQNVKKIKKIIIKNYVFKSQTRGTVCF